MANEQSFLDRIQRAGELRLAVASMVPVYDPADGKFSLVALEDAIEAAEVATNTLEQNRPVYQDGVADRVALVRRIGPLVTQALAYVKSNSAWAKRYEAVKNQADKVRGMKPRRPPLVPDGDQKSRNTGERSYVEIAAHFKRFIARVEGLAGYSPPDAKVGVAGLTGVLTELEGLNEAVPAAAQVLTDDIADRLAAFTGEGGLKEVFDGVKVSVKGQYGQGSVQFKSISGMKW